MEAENFGFRVLDGLGGTLFNWISWYVQDRYILSSCNKYSNFSRRHTEGWKNYERGIRIVYQDFDSGYESLLNRINSPTLELRRQRTIATEAKWA